mmetsp:Transcript_64059/g.116865  ORF Transcript_64059/g.116865 Transcript_64059/m.116865 type:complete len:816 (-) Transcript_64059:134-2581(-)
MSARSPILEYLQTAQEYAEGMKVNFQRSTLGWDRWIQEAVQDPLQGVLTSGKAWTVPSPPRQPEQLSDSSILDAPLRQLHDLLRGRNQALALEHPTRQQLVPHDRLSEGELSVDAGMMRKPIEGGAAAKCAPQEQAGTRPRGGSDETNESPTKKTRTANAWSPGPGANITNGPSAGCAPVASPCRASQPQQSSQSSGSCLGPIPKEPPGRGIAGSVAKENRPEQQRRPGMPSTVAAPVTSTTAPRLPDTRFPWGSPSLQDVAPAAFAEPSHVCEPGPLETPSPLVDAAETSGAWRSSALFAPLGGGGTAPSAGSAASAPGMAAPWRPGSGKPQGAATPGSLGTMPAGGAAASGTAPGGEGSVAEMVKRIEAPTEKGTPVSVLDRVKLFEGARSTPNLRQQQPAGSCGGQPLRHGGGSSTNLAPPPSTGTFTPTAGGGSMRGSAGSGSAGAPCSGGPINGSLLFAPVQATATIKKDLFGVNPQPSSTLERETAPQARSETQADSRPVPKAKAQAVVAHDLELAKMVNKANAQAAASASASSADQAQASAKPVAKKKANRRSAVACPEEVPPDSASLPREVPAHARAQQSQQAMEASHASSQGQRPQPGQQMRAPQQAPSQGAGAAAAAASASSAAHYAGQKENRPPVPAFEASAKTTSSACGSASSRAGCAGKPVHKPEPCMSLRLIELGPKRAEDNYEISEHGGDSDAEDQAERDRSKKHVPKWCDNYLDVLYRQADIDPDTIFASKVPHCALEEIFSDEMYKQAGKNRPKRARGSSGDWRKDRLRREEINHYKQRMGHVRSWENERSAAAAGRK